MKPEIKCETIESRTLKKANQLRNPIPNLSDSCLRTSVRRLTRLTNAFSKKWENLQAMLAVYFAFYNFCRASFDFFLSS